MWLGWEGARITDVRIIMSIILYRLDAEMT